jgi:S1-C subfamily serine protease
MRSALDSANGWCRTTIGERTVGRSLSRAGVRGDAVLDVLAPALNGLFGTEERGIQMKNIKQLATVFAFALGSVLVLPVASAQPTVHLDRLAASFEEPPSGAFAAYGSTIASEDRGSPLGLVAGPGDTIIAVNGQAINSTQDLVELVEGLTSPATLVFTVIDADDGHQFETPPVTL